MILYKLSSKRSSLTLTEYTSIYTPLRLKKKKNNFNTSKAAEKNRLLSKELNHSSLHILKNNSCSDIPSFLCRQRDKNTSVGINDSIGSPPRLENNYHILNSKQTRILKTLNIFGKKI